MRFIEFYLLECVGFLNVANGRKSLLDLFPDVCTIVDLEVFEANIWTLQTPTTPFLSRSLFGQPSEFANVKESSQNVNDAICLLWSPLKLL